MRCSCAHGGERGWLPCPFQNLSCDLKRRRSASGYTEERVANGEQRAKLPAIPYSLFARLFLLAGDRLGRPLARARVGMGTLATHRQAAAMTQAAIAAEIHQTLDVHAGLATQVAFDHVIAVDHFTNLQHFLIAQLRDTAINGDLDLFE